MRTGAAAAVASGIVLTLAACGSGETDIQKAAAECGVVGVSEIQGFRIGDQGNSLSIDGKGNEDSSGADITDIACVLNRLNVSDAIISRLDSTRALDGRQEGKWDGFTATWGYHPNSGLDMVIEVDGR
jgi:hypothetical protein